MRFLVHNNSGDNTLDALGEARVELEPAHDLSSDRFLLRSFYHTVDSPSLLPSLTSMRKKKSFFPRGVKC